MAKADVSSPSLLDLCEGLLEADGYNVSHKQNVVIAERAGTSGSTETRVVLIHEQSSKPPEEQYMEAIRQIYRNYPNCEVHLLTPTLEGFHPDFRKELKRTLRVRLQVPVQFFDLPFQFEMGGERSRSALRIISREGEEISTMRVIQPFEETRQNRRGRDLLNELHDLLSQRIEKPTLVFVIGPAGSGKSILFKCLYARLYKHYIDRKRKHEMQRRPLPLLPEHIRVSIAFNLEGLIDAFIQTEVARPLRRELFKWLLVGGYTTWLLDGLDELISSDPEFFNERIADLLLSSIEVRKTIKPPGKPVIAIFMRDAFMSSNTDLYEFLDEYSDHIDLKVYRLERWENEHHKLFAEKESGKLEGKTKTESKARFIRLVRREKMQELASIPYYCKSIWDLLQEGRAEPEPDEEVILEYNLMNIIEREYKEDKGLDKTLLPKESLLELLRDLSWVAWRSQDFGCDIEEIKGLAEIAVNSNQEKKQKEEAEKVLYTSLFVQGVSFGRVRFVHELLMHYLLGLHLFGCFQRAIERRESEKGIKDALRDFEVKPLEPDMPSTRILAKEIERNRETADLLGLITSGWLSEMTFRNLLQVYLLARGDWERFRGYKSDLLQQKKLERIIFREVPLNEFHFTNSDLTGCRFIKCDLRKSHFEDAILKATEFHECSLEGADFGDLGRAHSIIIDGNLVSARDELQSKLSQLTQKPVDEQCPCASFMQLRHLFLKFFRPDGRPRRSSIPVEIATKGKRYLSEKGYKECVKESIHFGYLVEDPSVRRYKLPLGGDKFSDLVGFIKDMSLPSGIKKLLDTLCDKEGCLHHPRKK